MAKEKSLGQELIGALEDVLEFEMEGSGLRTTTVVKAEPPRHWNKDQIARLRRDRLKISQPQNVAALRIHHAIAWDIYGSS